MPRFIIYEERAFIIEAEDEEDALVRFCDLSLDAAAELETESGGITEVKRLER